MPNEFKWWTLFQCFHFSFNASGIVLDCANDWVGDYKSNRSNSDEAELSYAQALGNSLEKQLTLLLYYRITETYFFL